MEQLFQDIRYGIRLLLGNPGFTIAASLILAIGIGAITAVFSLINHILLKPLPVRNPEQLIFVSHVGGKNPGDWFTYETFNYFRDSNQVFSDIFAFATVGHLNISIEGQDTLMSASGQAVSGNYYSALGVAPFLGRTITQQDDVSPNGSTVAVISYDFWKRNLALDPSVIGKTIFINQAPFKIIGVMPPEFYGLTLGLSYDVTIPITAYSQAQVGGAAMELDALTIEMMARLKPGVIRQQARANLNILWSQLDESFRQSPEQKIEIISGEIGRSIWRKRYSQPLYILMIIVALVLLIACANIANLMLVRGETRRHEIAVRLALGAGPFRIVRQLLVENFLLAILGGLLGLLLAFWGSNALLSLMINERALQVIDFNLDARVFAFTGLISLLSVMLFGLVPAFQVTRLDLIPSLKGGMGNQGGSATSLRLGKGLIIAQLAMSLALLIGAGLLVRSLQNLKGMDTGFNHENVLLVSIDTRAAGYRPAQLADFYTQLLERVESHPNVRSASLSAAGLFGGLSTRSSISIPGDTSAQGQESFAFQNSVGTRYFETVGMILLRGRDFTSQDNESAPKVAVINETMSRLYFPGEDPIGKHFDYDKTTGVEVVGLVKDAKYNSLREQPSPMFYTPYLQSIPRWREIEVRAASHPGDLAAMIRKEAQAINKNVFITDISTLSEKISSSLAQERLMAYLVSFFSLLALILSSVGLYGVISYVVTRRFKEIGIRMALGAQPGSVLRMILRETFLLVIIGIAIGLLIAFATGRLISSLLFGLTTNDPLTIGLAVIILILVAGLATYLPVKKALSIDPGEVLRYE